MNIGNAKTLLRMQMRRKRRMLGSALKQQKEQILLSQAKKLLKQYHPDVHNIGLYYPMGSEASLLYLPSVLGEDLCFFLPRVVAQNIIFYPFISLDDCEKDDKNIPAPKVNIVADVPDVIFVPMLAFTKVGYRLGQGGGFFDRYIYQARKNKKNTVFIGVAFERQKADNIPVERHDEMLDMIITEKTIYQCKKR